MAAVTVAKMSQSMPNSNWKEVMILTSGSSAADTIDTTTAANGAFKAVYGAWASCATGSATCTFVLATGVVTLGAGPSNEAVLVRIVGI